MINLNVIWSAVAALAMAGSAVAAPFSDGSFETPGNGMGRTDIGAGIGPWVHGGTGLDLYEFTGNDGQVAQDGVYFLGFGHSGSVGGTLSQTFDTVAGQSYTVSYYTAKQQDGSPLDAAMFDVSVMNAANGAILATMNSSVLGTAWVKQSMVFGATGASSTLTFRDDGGVNNIAYNLSVDNFSVANNVQAVPEPTSLAMLSVGLVAVGIARRRKSSSSAV